MNTEFCTNCGCKAEYTLNKPRFCSSCGVSMNPAAEIANVASWEEGEAPLPPKEEGVPRITKLEYSIGQRAKDLTFGDLVTEASNNPNGKYERMEGRPRPEDSNQDALQQTMDQCRSAREPINLGGE